MSSFELGLTKPWPWPGGKTPLVKTILKFAPKKFSTYIEPFAGSATVYFNLPEAPKRAVLADNDKQLMSAYRDFSCRKIRSCIVRNKPSLKTAKKFTDRFKRGSSDSCDYFMARRLSYNSNGRDVDPNKAFTPGFGSRVVKDCPEVEKRLRRAKLVTGDFQNVVKKNDRKDAFIYFDPPYPNKIYRFFKDEKIKPEEVCAVARKAKGTVLISYPDTLEVRKACAGLHVKRVPVRYTSRTMNFREHQKDHELLLSNRPLKKSTT